MTPAFPTPAVIGIKIRKIIDRFRQHGAVSPDHSQSLESLGLSNGLVLRRLIWHGVIIEVPPYKYYLNEENLAIYNNTRRTRILFVVVFIIIAFALYVLLHPNP